MSEADQVVRVRLEGGFYTEGLSGPHVVAMDEPESVGGTFRGPTPMRMLLLALGGCSAITLRLYASRKGWDLRSVDVAVTLTPARGKEPARLEQELTLDGDLDDEQRARLLEIAGRCPVHKLLEGPVVTDERLARGPG